MKKSPFTKNCRYDYEHKCDCAEDDKCGCVFPNNMARNFTSSCFESKDDDITIEKLNIGCLKNNNVEILPVKEKQKKENQCFG